MNFKKIKRTILVSLSLALTTTVGAQTLDPQISSVEFDGDTRPSLTIVVAPEPTELKKAWRDYLKENYDVRLKGIGFLTNKDVLTAEEVTISQMSPNALDFHTRIVAGKDGTRMDVFAAHGYDVYVNPEDRPQEFEKMNQMVEGFLSQYIPEHFAEKVEEKKEVVTELAEELTSKEEDILSMKEEVAELKEEIESLEKSIDEESSDLEETTEELTQQRNELNQLKSKLEEVK